VFLLAKKSGTRGYCLRENSLRVKKLKKSRGVEKRGGMIVGLFTSLYIRVESVCDLIYCLINGFGGCHEIQSIQWCLLILAGFS